MSSDSLIWRSVWCESRTGYSCVAVHSAAEARGKLTESPGFQLMLCDVNMPGESGLDLVRDMSWLSPDTAVVMITGVDDPALAEVALDNGAYGYVIKPFEANEVIINVSNALRRRTLEIENHHHRVSLEQTLLERTSDATPLRSCAR